MPVESYKKCIWLINFMHNSYLHRGVSAEYWSRNLTSRLCYVSEKATNSRGYYINSRK